MVAPGLDRKIASGAPVRRLLFGAMVVGFLALIAAGIAVAWVMSVNQQHIAAITHTYQVEQHIAQLRLTVERAETARRGYIVDSTPRWEYRFLRNALARDPGVEMHSVIFHPGMAPGGGRNC